MTYEHSEFAKRVINDFTPLGAYTYHHTNSLSKTTKVTETIITVISYFWRYIRICLKWLVTVGICIWFPFLQIPRVRYRHPG